MTSYFRLPNRSVMVISDVDVDSPIASSILFEEISYILIHKFYVYNTIQINELKVGIVWVFLASKSNLFSPWYSKKNEWSWCFSITCTTPFAMTTLSMAKYFYKYQKFIISRSDLIITQLQLFSAWLYWSTCGKWWLLMGIIYCWYQIWNELVFSYSYISTAYYWL